MKKTIFALAVGIIIIGAGCQKTAKVSVNLNDLEKKLDAPPQTATKADDCSAIMSASGDPLFTNADAQALFGGSWTKEINITKKTITGTGGCIYMMSEDYNKADSNRQLYSVSIQTQTKAEFDRFLSGRGQKGPESMEVDLGDGKKMTVKIPVPTYKDIPNLGDQTILVYLDNKTTNPILYVKQGDKYMWLSSWPASEAQITSIAKTIVSRW